MKSVILRRCHSLRSRIILIASFTFLMVLASYVRVHLFFTPVPVTLQTFVIFLSLALLREESYIPQALYLIMGASGIAVFGNGGAGIIYILGPTGGYLMGFLASALIAGVIMHRAYGIVIKKPLLSYAVLFSVVNTVVYIFGISWLIGIYKVSFKYAFNAGIIPFIIPDAVKIILAAYISSKLTRV